MKTMLSMSTATVRRFALAFGMAAFLATTAGCAADSSEPDPSAATETPSAPTAPTPPNVTHQAPAKVFERAPSATTALDRATPLADGDGALDGAQPIDFNQVPGLGQPRSSLPTETNQRTEQCIDACAVCYSSTSTSSACTLCHSLACQK